MTENSIWPIAEEFSDSDDEKETAPQKRARFLDNKPSVTEEEISGDFPVLKLKNRGDGSSSSSEDEEEKNVKPKANPYLISTGDSIREKFDDKLRSLHMKRNEARKLNHREVAAEDQRKKQPTNYDSIRKRAEWELDDKTAREVYVYSLYILLFILYKYLTKS